MRRGRPKKNSLDVQWEALRLPNAGLLSQTPSSLAIDLRYAELRIWDRWDYERFIRLAKFLNVTLYELASLACLSHKQVPALEAHNRLMKGRDRDVAGAMVLTLLESHVCAAYTKDVVEKPFPNLNELPRSAAT